MGYRLSRIYTRTGDTGETGLADGQRVSKDSCRIELLGELDELNARIGLLLTEDLEPDLRGCLDEIQQLIFDLGGDFSIPGRVSIQDLHLSWLESWIDHYNQRLPPLREFVLPGGSRTAAIAHLARTASRSVERKAVRLHQKEILPPETLGFLNRLSDFLFIACRLIARRQGPEPQWRPHREPPSPPMD